MVPEDQRGIPQWYETATDYFRRRERRGGEVWALAMMSLPFGLK